MKRSVYILFVIAMGLAGAVLRGLSIVNGMEPANGLPIAGDVPAMALKLACAAGIILSIVLSRSSYRMPKGTSYEQLMGKMGHAARVVCMVCGAAMAVIGVAALVNLGGMVAEETSEYHPFGVAALVALAAQWILCVVSGVTLLLFARRQDGYAATKRQGVFVCLPMFWACLSLIMTYHENSSNPVMQDYAYDLLLIIAVMAAFYYIAGLFFAEPHPVCIALFSGLSVFLMLTCDGGMLLAACMNRTMAEWVLTAPLADLFRMAACLFATVYLLVQLTQFGQTTETA
ncbi:MAG: hypothetical protein Q4F79_04725 [Eubacteriales bacterium]|nr:hypothetical protein [Eubacteriales bacterium]